MKSTKNNKKKYKSKKISHYSECAHVLVKELSALMKNSRQTYVENTFSYPWHRTPCTRNWSVTNVDVPANEQANIIKTKITYINNRHEYIYSKFRNSTNTRNAENGVRSLSKYKRRMCVSLKRAKRVFFYLSFYKFKLR